MRRSQWERPRFIPPLRQCILAALLVLFIPALATAQANKWKDYDSTEHRFQIGAVGLLLPRLGHDELSIDFSRFYRINRFNKLTSIVNAPANWHERIDSAFWRQADAIGYTVICPMERIVQASEASDAIEHCGNYAGTMISVEYHTTGYYV